jgi:enterochelin esterase-like enzyme
VSLTGGPFLVLVAALTVAAFVALVVTWPWFAGRTVGWIAARVGMLLVVNVLVLFSAAVWLNDTFLFYASWVDLHGALTGTVTKTSLDEGGNAAAAAREHVSGSAATAGTSVPDLSQTRMASSGVGSFHVRGPASGLSGNVLVQVPPGYFDPANATRKYPVLEAFSGYPGSPYQWVSVISLASDMATQVAQGHMRPAVIVMPQQWFPAGVDTECVNGAASDPQVETWLTDDVPRWVAHTFRVNTQRSSWATIGLSAGGWCANMAAMLHPAQYGAVIDMGGYFRPELSPFYQPYPEHGALAQRYDLVARSERDPPPIAMWLETSHADDVSYKSSAAFLKEAKAPMAIHAVVLRNAGHRISVWQALLPESLRWLGHTVPGFG